MTRSVLRFVDWLFTPDRSEGAPAGPLFEIECTTCPWQDVVSRDGGSRSPASEDFAEVQSWAIRHSARNPSHNQFRETVTRYWRTSMEDGPTP